MAVVSNYLIDLIAKQVDDHRLVVWYDPERAYASVAEALSLPKTTVARYEGSFFQLRHDIDNLMNAEQPPRLVIYVPLDQSQTDHALVELEAAGVVMQPRQQPPQRNTRLARNGFPPAVTGTPVAARTADRSDRRVGFGDSRITGVGLGCSHGPCGGQGKVGLYRLGVGCSPGTGKLKIAGGVEGGRKESIQRAYAYLMGQKGKMGVAQQVDTTDFHVEAIDLLSNHVACEAGIALMVAVYSAIKKTSVLAGLVILGDLSIQGNIKSQRSLSEPLQVAMDSGARRALIPPENKRNFLEYLEALANPKHERHKELRAWSGPFDPVAFDAVAVTRRMQRGFPKPRPEDFI